MSLAGMSYMVLMPIFTAETLNGGAEILGFLMASSGFGALFGALFLASKKNVRGMLGMIPVATCIFGAGLILFSASKILWLSLIIQFIVGFGFMVQLASCNTVLQTIVDDSKRGRVMSLYAAAFMGLSPFGSLLAGSIANHIGSAHTIALGGLLIVLGALIFAFELPLLKKSLLPIYKDLGIIP